MEILIVLNSWATSACAQLFNADLSPDGEGYPTQSWMRGGNPIQSWMGGTPSSLNGGNLIQSSTGDTQVTTPLPWSWMEVPPISRMGPLLIWTWDGVPPRPGAGYPPYPDLGWGTPISRFWIKYKRNIFGKNIRVYSPPGEAIFRIFCDVICGFPILSNQMLPRWWIYSDIFAKNIPSVFNNILNIWTFLGCNIQW